MACKIDFTDNEKNYIIQQYKSGSPSRKIAKKMGVNSSTIINRLKKWGVNTNRSKYYCNFSKKNKREIIKLYNDGFSAEYISKFFDCSYVTILNHLEKWKVNIRNDHCKRTKFTKKEKEEIIQMYNNNLSTKKIGSEFNVSPETIRNYLNKWEVSTIPEKYYFNPTAKDKIKIISLYESTYSPEVIANIYGVSRTTILNKLKKWGVETSEKSYKLVFTEKQVENMIYLYKNEGHSVEKIGEIYNVSCSVIYRVFREHSIDTSQYRCDINENYFAKIDTREKAYWLGFILADGCVHKNNLIIGLQRGDYLHLKKFADDIGSSHKISIRDDGVSICISNKKIVEDLKKYGVVPRKSLIVMPYLDIAPEFEADLWRGWIDGDGSIGITRDGKIWFSFLGTMPVCNALKDWCLKYIDSKAKVRKYSSVYTFSLSTSKAVPIIRVLYKDAPIYLTRKYERAMQILALYN